MLTIQRRLAYAFILLLGLAWIFLSADKNAASFAGTTAAPHQGFLAPDFSLPTTDGETIRLSDLRGQAVLINLWATWCPPCRAEMPAIEKIYNEYKDRGFIVLAIDMTYQDDASEI
ncbi:MAG TPA: TlpA disulfide reductase family protein, partial [Anaerolineales bacterium]|nr:TlpA disulfide reductase family protein [Anaerolineales bacterium]